MLSHSTGNEFISVPSISSVDGAVNSATLLSTRFKGLLELCASGKETPFLKPTIFYKKKVVDLSGLKWSLEHYWIPTAVAETSAGTVRIQYVAPPDVKGFSILVEIADADGEPVNAKDFVCVLEGRWGALRHHVNLSSDVPCTRRVRQSVWENGLYFEARYEQVLIAFCAACSNVNYLASAAGLAKMPKTLAEVTAAGTLSGEITSSDGEDIAFILAAAPEDHNGAARLGFHIGCGQEEISAVTTAAHLQRLGADRIIECTVKRLQEITLQASDADVQTAINRNAMFCHFYSTGKTFDSEEFVVITSRSPEYYVSGAYWDRDALLWTLPCVMQQDHKSGRKILEYAFKTQLKNSGIHSRFIDGSVLEPGMELDQLCAPVIELVHYVRFTNDYDFPRERFVQEALADLRARVLALKCRNAFLFRTFLNSTDEIPPYPVVTYMNVLAWRFFFDLAFLEEKLNPSGARSVENRNNALRLRREIYTHCIREVDGVDVFAYSVPVDGEPIQYDPLQSDRAIQDQIAKGVYDDPMGSLITLPYWGFCKFYDPIYDNTVKLLMSRENPNSHSGKKFAFGGAYHGGEAHGPFVASLANQLLVRINQQKIKDLLPELGLDNGIACESINSDTGTAETGKAMASMAGFWAYSMYRGLAKVSTFGWPEPSADDVSKTEGAIRIATLAAGMTYPRPASQLTAEDIGAMPRTAISERSPAKARPATRVAPVLPPRGAALTRGQVDEFTGSKEIPDDIGNRIRTTKPAGRRGFSVSDEESDFGPGR